MINDKDNQSKFKVVENIEFKKILNNNHLFSYVQLIVDLKSCTNFGYEFLIRGPVNSRLHAADKLFYFAKELGLQRNLEIASINLHLNNASNSSLNGCFTINLTPTLLLDEEVQNILINYKFPHKIKIEFTEHLNIEDWKPINKHIEKLKCYGYDFWLDDVGCGYFDLSLVNEIKPDVVKLCIKIISKLNFDESLIKDISQLVENVHKYGGMVLAEGVENANQLTIIKNLNIDLAQGYFFGKPTPLI
ncbi:EAL domain-containing protein [Shewanella cutis]|uniref:EAL domain-containing protein n=1 Tax=Shewanella cutis TaxID=2766780 RepID=A0ABS9R0C8_9GAMM|nr:EAL domain-containing protein [Shewanella sp. PS-2]MCG9966057.1 EAL domain-containing protein [Shewanella sp. PS-2]